MIAALTILFLLAGPQAIGPALTLDQRIQNLIGPIEGRYDTLAQKWWPDVFIIEFVPSNYVHELSRDTLARRRIAFDTTGRYYELWGFAGNDFPHLIDDHPLRLKASQVRAFGEFFINTTVYFDWDKTYFLSTERQFLDLNRKLLEEGTSGIPKERWNETQTRIKNVLAGLELTKTVCDTASKSWLADCYVWRRGNGNLEHVALRIWPDGRCTDMHIDTLAQKFGYWQSLKK